MIPSMIPDEQNGGLEGEGYGNQDDDDDFILKPSDKDTVMIDAGKS